ncbi:MAG TPA: response regulator [Gammaproteobacteria bacterium]|jgi:CheY-like chemotaxis protein|nr:response regulator [Gammaproteobacteria bacterium]
MNLFEGENAVLPGKHLLVVEDEMMLVMLIEDWLGMLGCTATTAASVEQALELAESEAFDGALLDVNLGTETSYPIAEKLDELGIPFIFMTGYGVDMLREDYRDRPTVRKPFELDHFERLMAETFAEEGSEVSGEG